MESLEAELERARELDESELADAIETIGFECTRCGKCCKGVSEPPSDEPTSGEDSEPRVVEEHTATVFPDEIRRVQDAGDYDFRDVARPMPFGLDEDGTGETFEWALQTDACGDCTFYTEDESGTGACTVHDDRPLICETYPFSIVLASDASESSSDESDGDLEGASQPMGGVVDTEGQVRAHECDGLGLDIDRDHAEDLASALKERAIREIKEAIGVRDNYQPVDPAPDETVVHDSEGAKRPDGTPYQD